MRVRLWVDPDGLGPNDPNYVGPDGQASSPVITVVTANLTAPETIAAFPGTPLGLRPAIVWDASTGSNRGRLYVAYEDPRAPERRARRR